MGAEWWIINKNDLVTGSTTPRSVSFGPYPSLASVHPVVSLSSTSTEYMVSTGAQEIHTSTTTALLFSVTGIPGVSTVTNATISLTVQNITLPSNAYHPPDDMRVQSAVWFNGKAWFGLDTSCIPTGDTTTRGCIRLIQADTTALQIKQDFNLYVAGNDAFYSSLSTDSMGSLAVVYDYASGLSGPKIAVTGQAINDPADTLVQSTIIKASNTFNLSGNLGDYFGTAVDPTDPTIVWVIGEYVTSSLGHCGDFSSCWATYITDMRVRPTITVNNTTTFLGYSVTTNGTLTTNAPLNNLTLSGKITVSASNSSGLVFSKTYTVANVLIRNYTSGPPTAPYRAVLLLNVGVNSCPGYNVTCHLSSDNSISYDGASAIDTVTVSRNIDINQDGIVNNSDLSIVSASLYCNVGQACYNPQADVNADGTINAVDLSTVSNFGNAPDYI